MFKKKDCVVAIVVIYGFLLMLFLAEKKTKNFNSPCSWYEPCVRFCCNNKTTCNDKFIRENFNSSLLPESVRNETIEYKILLGRPTCSLKLLPNTSDEPWSFSEGGDVRLHSGHFSYFEPDFYCLEMSNEVDWNLFVCEYNNYYIQKILSIIMSFISVLTLSATVFVYAYVKKLRTVPGKCFLFFAVGLLTVFLTLPLLHYDFYNDILHFAIAIMLTIGLEFSFLWISVMSFDIWWTFRDFRQMSDDKEGRFKFYCAFVGFFMALVNFIAITEIFALRLHISIYIFFLFSFYLMAALDVIFILITAYKIFQISKASNNSENFRFHEEVDRFWSYVELYGIMLITFPIELFSYSWRTQYEMMMIADFIKLLSSIVVFVIFVLEKDVRSLLFKNYNTLTNT